MKKLVLIDGPYGVGKTSVANSLMRKLDDWQCLDADAFFNEYLKKDEYIIFGGMPLQRNNVFLYSFRHEIENYMSNENSGCFVVLSLARDEARCVLHDYLVKRYECVHVILLAEKATIIERIETDCRIDNNLAISDLDRGYNYLVNNYPTAVFIDTTDLRVEDIAEHIIQQLIVN